MSFTYDDLSKIILASGLTSDEVSKTLKAIGISFSWNKKNIMKTAEQILKDMPSIKQGLDDFYGRQTVLNALNLALSQGQILPIASVSPSTLLDTHVILCKPNYIGKDGSIKKAIVNEYKGKGTWLAPKDDLY